MSFYGLPVKLKDAASDKNGLPAMPKESRTFGQRAADKLTEFCGTWTFIIGVLVYIAIWIILNMVAWGLQWDPWPFIILNLTLSCLAALQAPVILMSNKRVSEKDRLSQRYDYLVDRKTCRDVQLILNEIEEIHKKLDELKHPN